MHTGAEYSRVGLTKAENALAFAILDKCMVEVSSLEIQDLGGFYYCMMVFDNSSVCCRLAVQFH